MQWTNLGIAKCKKKEKENPNPTFKKLAILSYLRNKILTIFWMQASLAEHLGLVLQHFVPMGPQIWESQVSYKWCNISM